MATLEWWIEEAAIQICKRQPELVSAFFTHYDSKEARKSNRIVVMAKKGARRDDGPGGWDCELSVEYVTPKQIPVEQADLVMSGIERAFTDASLASTEGIDAFSQFRVLVINETGGDGSKENQDKHRVRTKVIPVIADLF